MVSRVASSSTPLPDVLTSLSSELSRSGGKEENRRPSSSSSGTSSIVSAPSGISDEEWVDMLPRLPVSMLSPVGSPRTDREEELGGAATAKSQPSVFSQISAEVNVDNPVGPCVYVYKVDAESNVSEARYKTFKMGEGGGDVSAFEALDLKTKEIVILKTNRLQHDPRNSISCVRIEREASILRKLKDSHYAPVIKDYFYANSQQRVLVLDRLEPRYNVQTRFNVTWQLQWPQLVSIAFQSLHALYCFQEKGIIHADLKPKKLSLDPSMQLKFVGFERAQRKSYLPKASEGLNAYSAPEACLNLPSDSSVDVWSTGLILTDLATGQTLIQERLEKCENPIKVIAISRGLPPKEWLDKSMVTPQFFVKSSDGHYSLLAHDPKHHRPVDSLGEYLRKNIEERWSRCTLAEERHHLIDLIDKMTSYQKRISPLEAIAHPLFDKYVFLQIRKVKESPITRVCISIVKPGIHGENIFSKFFIDVDFRRYPQSSWLLHNCENKTSLYNVILYNGATILKTEQLHIPSRALLELRSDSDGNPLLDIHPFKYKQVAQLRILSSIASSSSSSCASPWKYTINSERQSMLHSLADLAISTSSFKSTRQLPSSTKVLLRSKGRGSSLASGKDISSESRKRASQVLESASTATLKGLKGDFSRMKRLKKM